MQVSHFRRLRKPWLATAGFAAGALSTCTSLAQESFHITFGTTGTQQSHDGASFVVRADNGDVVVAGSGGSFYSDDRDGVTYPLIARVDPDGELKWQRVYRELENQRIVAFLGLGEEQFMVLRANPTLRELEAPPPDISLRRVDGSGDVSESLGTLGGFSIVEPFPVEGAEPYFLVVAARHAAPPASFLDVRLFRLDLRGNVLELASVPGIGSLENLTYPGGEAVLVSRWRQAGSTGDGRASPLHTELIRIRLTGETELALTIPNRLCRSLAASLTSIYCVEYEWPGTRVTSDGLVSYSPAGQVLWRHDLESGMHVQQMRPVDSGGLIYSYVDGMDTVITRLSGSGASLWTRRLRSSGPYVFLGGIEQLRDERLALVGSTGNVGAFVSTDTDAVLIVTDVSQADLSASIISTVVSSADMR
jgi:hypothetical protein